MSRSRIIARLHDGLGNQLFIYAAARAIAEARDAALVLDVQSGFAHDRKYGATSQLQHFRIKADVAPVSQPRFARQIRDLQNALSTRLPPKRRFVIREADFDTVMAGAPLRSSMRLEGYWQSERYFRSIAPKIRNELEIASPLSPRSEGIANLISNTQAICFHVRQMHGAHHAFDKAPPADIAQLPFSYYEAAVARVVRQVEHPTFFVFADNFEWIRARWQFPYPVHFVDHNRGDRSYEDLALMRLCRHFIIGNSTFSWWGAWLARSPSKIVIAPDNRGKIVWGSEADLLPKEWDVLKVAAL
jgi:hypothetical protein